MTDALLLTFIFLVAGVISVPIASRLGLGSVLGYLLAGIVISPILTLLEVDIVSIQHFAELGVVLMLFIVGLELNPKKLWELKSKLIGLGGGQVALTALLIMGIGMLLDQEWRTSLAIGLVLALSSTAIVIQTLTEKGLMKSDGGQSSFAVLLAQDIVVIPILAFIPLLATPELITSLSNAAASQGESHSASLVDGLEAWQTTLVTVGAIGIVVLGGSFLATPIFRFIAVAQLRELFTATALMFVIGTTLLMSVVGLSPALGTFLAGVVLANSPYRHELESDIAPFKGLLLGLFFMTVGASINFSLLFSDFASILGLTIGLIFLKATTLLILGRLFHIRGSNKWLFALGLAQAGEFGFVLLSFTVSNAVISQDIADVLLLVVALSMLLTPILFIIYDRLIAPRYATDKTAGTHDNELPDDNKIIIAGSGRMGSTIDNLLRLAGYHSTVIDFSVKRLRVLEKFGVKNYFGDATRPDLLHAAGIDEASLLIIAIDDPKQITKLVKYVRESHPDVHIIARAFDNNHVYDLWASGCRDIIRENFDSSLRMGRSAFEALGITHHKAEQMIDVFSQHDKVSMVEVADAHQIGVPSHENNVFITRLKKYLEEKNPQLQKAMKDIQNQTD